MLSAKSGDIDKILSLGIGADDYITKPFSPDEVIARIKAQLRRYKTFSNQTESQSGIKEFNDLTIDSNGYKVSYKGEEIHFTSREFEIIDFLSEYPGQVFSKNQVYDNVWGLSGFGDLNTVSVYIKRIREKFAKFSINYIKTVCYNLVSNSIKYSKEDSTIGVYFEVDLNYLKVYVKDTWLGIASDDVPYIFNKFYRGEKNRNQNIPGSGLELSISKYIVEAYGGFIECIESSSKGTTMCFSIPL